MTAFQLAAMFLVLVSLAGWVNARLLHWPVATAMVVAGLINAAVLMLAARTAPRDSAPRSSYRSLPGVDGYALQNRFVGDYLLYGAGAGWRRPQSIGDARAFAVRYARPEIAHEIVNLIVRNLRSEVFGRDFFDEMRFVENHCRVFRKN